MNQIRDHVMNGKLEAAKLLMCPNGFTRGKIDRKRGGSNWKTSWMISIQLLKMLVPLKVYKLEKNVNILATVAGAAPMIGFLGTVIGMILSFP